MVKVEDVVFNERSQGLANYKDYLFIWIGNFSDLIVKLVVDRVDLF